MDNRDDQSRRVASEILKVEGYLSPESQRRYKLPMLLRLARRVTAFAPECEICQGLQNQITNLGANLAGEPRMTRKDFRAYLSVIKGITRHLKKTHGLAEERQYVKRYVFMGLTLGLSLVVLGLILLSFGFTFLALNITVPALATRVVFAATIGHIRDKRAKRRGSVL